ncbi:intraflagellar transport protein 140 homolog, partial [Nilaparvata lugens]|uniref:intraflagellar transport protein 140 homolog n=1 Tax=Nilaparvata lugens TaxID=108931 RepID=UPI00193D4E6F
MCSHAGQLPSCHKKFTQAGNKVKAMKALLKSGDTEKVIFFATVSRQREIYVMAANYLQSLEWQSQPDLLKNIVTFYTKGRAPHLLANFYTSCAQVEIDEYGNYEKALGALNEAARCLSKDSDQYASVVESVARKTASVKKFLDIRRMLDRGEAESGLQQCRQLLSAGCDLVRSGDVYSLMIEQATKANDWRTAARLAQELRQAQPHDNLSLYIPK